MTQIPKNPLTIHYYSLRHITVCITIIELGILTRIMDNQVQYPWEAACGLGWRCWDNPLSYRSGGSHGAHCYNRDLASGWRWLPDVLRESVGAGLVP